MALAVAVPLCGWFLAACVSSSLSWEESNCGASSQRKIGTGKGQRRAIYSRQKSAGRIIIQRPAGLYREFPNGSTSKGCKEPVLSADRVGGISSGVASGQRNNIHLSGLPRTASTMPSRKSGTPTAVAAAAAATVAETLVRPDFGEQQQLDPVPPPLSPPRPQRRVVVTGMAVVSCLGHDPETFYDNLLAGKSGITPIEGFDVEDFPTRIAGQIKDFNLNGYVNPKMAKRMDPFMWYLLTAGKRALEDGGMGTAVLEALDKSKCGILIGSAMGGMQVFNDAIEALNVSYRRMNPFCIPFVTTNMGSAMLAMDLGWMGPNYSISTACATGNYCILSAANHIIRGEADVMLSGGSDAAILPIGLGGFVACRALSKRNDAPERASRPWDKDRDGFVMGEGAGVLLLEELEHAKKRGANIYAEFLGGSFTCDAYHMTEPHPEGQGVNLCIEQALKSSGVAREDVNYINAHATSTQAGDLQEYKAIVKSFGKNKEVKINSTKSMIGHLLGAAGAVEAVATVQAIRTGWIHPNLNIENPEAIVDTNLLVGAKKEPMDIKVALSNSFGFGGHNSSILFAPYKDQEGKEAGKEHA